MNQKSTSKNRRGFVKTIVLIIIGILLLAYFGEDIKKFLQSPETKEAIRKIIVLLRFLWDSYIREPFYFLWNKIVVDILWNMIIKPALDQAR